MRAVGKFTVSLTMSVFVPPADVEGEAFMTIRNRRSDLFFGASALV